MSMIGNLVRVSDAKLAQLHANPDSIESFLYPDSSNPNQPGFFARLFGAKTENATTDSAPVPESDQADLGKTWHAIHFLFTGTDWDGEFPNCFLVDGGTAIGDIDVGYGPARSFTPKQVDEINTFLQNTDDEELKSRLSFEKMKKLEIYPHVWDDDSIDSEWEYIQWGLETVRNFVSETSSKSMGLIVYLN